MNTRNNIKYHFFTIVNNNEVFCGNTKNSIEELILINKNAKLHTTFNFNQEYQSIRKWINYADVHYDTESPCFFLMSNTEGKVLYSDSYSSLPFDPEKISNIQRKIQLFCDEKRAEEKIIRFCFQEYLCLLKTEQNLNICYVFMGNSYLPLKKMRNLLSNLNNSGILTKIKTETEKNVNLSLQNRIELSKLVDRYLISQDAMNS